MQDSYIIGQMNSYMHQLSEALSVWLGKKLPNITENWWNDLVYNNLTQLQRDKVDLKHISQLNGLDLASLLRVFDRNWFLITNTCFVNSKYRHEVKEMMEIRNYWAHLTTEAIPRNRVSRDIQTITSLMSAFDADNNAIQEIESFAVAVESDKDVALNKEILVNQIVDEKKKSECSDNDIHEGSIVSLVSDPSKIGAVTAIVNNTYKVWMDNSLKTFYREQIQLKEADTVEEQTDIERIKAALTAYQIANPGSSSLYSLNSARIDFVPYQFRPALKMIKADSPRLLVADDVGVGKTIEAGLILKEMEARSVVDSILIICPRPLVAERKWVLEMKRFDEDFTQLDGKELNECILETDRDGEWPERHKKTIIPYSLFGEDILSGTDSQSGKKRKTKGLLQLDPSPHFDLVIVDEAHTIRNSNTWAYKGVELFVKNADAVVFLTATPLQNSNDDLYTLLNLLRPDMIVDRDTFSAMAEPNVYVNSLLRIIRNQDSDWQSNARDEISNILTTQWGRNVIQHNPNFEKVYELLDKESITREEKVEAIHLVEGLHSFNSLITRTRRRDIEDFCIRHTQTIEIPFTPEQSAIYEALMEFKTEILTRLHGSRSVRFMMCTIMRQASSCIYGLVPFVEDIVKRNLSQLELFGDSYEEDIDEDEIKESVYDLAEKLKKMSSDCPEYDPKLEKLYEVIEQKQKEENNRIILFSSFRHTLNYIKSHLISKGYRVAQVDGSVPDEERYRIRERFMLKRGDEHAIDVLLFSEVGCEGLDYQFCDTMINYDLPWNPMRIEQRIGRIDRRGQTSETVRIYNMITAETIDAIVYDRCLSKIGLFEASIGDCSEILGSINEQIMQIMLDPSLTDDDRKMKIEKMADNEIMRVQELNRLEQEEKALYGFDLAAYIQDKDVQDAENDWISPESISRLVDVFLEDSLGEGEYIISNKQTELRTMRISTDNKRILLNSFQRMNVGSINSATKLWNAYLKSKSPLAKVTYDSSTAKENRTAIFLTQMHPLVQQAAQSQLSVFPCLLGLSVSDDTLPSGDYSFELFAWEYKGLKPDTRIIAISNNEKVSNSVLNFIQYASSYSFNENDFSDEWISIDSLHYDKWQQAKEEYVASVKEECNYRIEQLSQSHIKSELLLKAQLETATDERIVRMKTSQLENLKQKYLEQKERLDSTGEKADIHASLLVKGMLHVE